MLDLIEKVAVAALGAATITQKMGEELLSEVKEKYRLSEDEGKQFLDRIQMIARSSSDRIQQLAEVEVKKVIDSLGLITRDEYEVLQQRIKDLEMRTRE